MTFDMTVTLMPNSPMPPRTASPATIAGMAVSDAPTIEKSTINIPAPTKGGHQFINSRNLLARVIVLLGNFSESRRYTVPMESSPESGPGTCANCGHTISERFCGHCGQARFVDADRRFGHLVKLAMLDVFSWDGRWLRSFWALLARPGRLAHSYLSGQRQRYLSPITLFLLINVAYFLSPPITDFNLPFEDQAGQQLHAPLTTPLLERHLRLEGLTRAEYAPVYESRSGEIGKLLLIVHAPIIALALMLALWGSGRYYAEHTVVALHLLTWTLVLPMLVAPMLYLIAQFPQLDSDRLVGGGHGGLPIVFRLLLAGSLLRYFALTVRRAYRAPWWRALLAALICVLALACGHMIYRGLQFVAVIWLS